jgi:murein DD-endopeptidase MepM/ murein hydrolase activator NlpD
VESARLDLDWFKEPEWGPLTHWPVNSRALSVGGNPWSEGHQALDLAARMGDPVFAAHSGQVTEVGYQDDGYGHYITIAGLENGVSTLYAHLSRVDVAEGDIIDGGQRIGAAGSTGASTGPHLHFELVEDGGRVNAWPELQRVK